MYWVTIEPGDATRYTAIYGRTEDRLFLAFNSGDDSLIGFLWPTYLGYISYSYFDEKMGRLFSSRWTAGVCYLLLMHLLKITPDDQDLQKEAIPSIIASLRLSWLDFITIPPIEEDNE